MMGVDICDADIEKMTREGSPRKACATTNWKYNGELGMRVLSPGFGGVLPLVTAVVIFTMCLCFDTLGVLICIAGAGDLRGFPRRTLPTS